MHYEDVIDLPSDAFKRLTGVRKETFSAMLAALQSQIRPFGRPPTLSLADQLLLTLTYWREYRTQFHIAQNYGLSEATVCRTITKIENALTKSGQFRLPGKKALHQDGCAIEVVLVDATEQPIERPKKQRDHYSGKKKRHTQKAQLAIDACAKRVLATAFGKGALHDFALYKQNKLPLQPTCTCKADSGYLGIAKLHATAQIPKKRSKHHPLTDQQKADNRQLASERMLIEHVIGWIKRFRMLAEKYRNRRKRFALRFNLIAAIYNLEMATK